MSIIPLLNKTKIIPVITLHKVEHAVPLAETLLNAGLEVLEITLRTPRSIEAIREIKRNLPECKIIAGTVLTEAQFKNIQDLDLLFTVSPGLTANLVHVAKKMKMLYVPGVATCSEIMTGKELGLSEFKFFPAGLLGGIKALNNFAELFPEISFCPTGGISEDNLNDYLALSNVFCVGGSWITPVSLIEKNDWKNISERAKSALKIVNTMKNR